MNRISAAGPVSSDAKRRKRIKAALCLAAFHAALGYALTAHAAELVVS